MEDGARLAEERPRRRRRLAGALVALPLLVLAGPWFFVTHVVHTRDARTLESTRAAFVGHWTSRALTLDIGADGHVMYSRYDGVGTTTYGGRIYRFEGDDFSILVYPFVPAKFKVTSPPAKGEDGKIRMTVDGVVIEKSGG